MPTLTWTEPASYEGTITTLYITRYDLSTVYVIPDFFGPVSQPVQVEAGDEIHLQYRYWDDRKHGWGSEQYTSFQVGSQNVHIDIMGAEPITTAGGEAAGTLIIISIPDGAEVEVDG